MSVLDHHRDDLGLKAEEHGIGSGERRTFETMQETDEQAAVHALPFGHVLEELRE